MQPALFEGYEDPPPGDAEAVVHKWSIHLALEVFPSGAGTLQVRWMHPTWGQGHETHYMPIGSEPRVWLDQCAVDLHEHLPGAIEPF